MTWVIGTSSFAGYGVMLSDVQITFRNGDTRDILRKAYPISNHVVAGFAGSVRTGFVLLQSLADFLHIPNELSNTMAWEPLWIANNWPKIARQVFENQPTEERRLGSEILLVAIAPAEDRGAPEFPKVYLLRFVGPQFRAGIVKTGFQAISIGSGAGVAYYKQALKQLCRMSSGSHQAEVGRQFGWADLLCFSLARSAVENPVSGVSQHFHVLAFNRSHMLNVNSDHRTHADDDTPPVEHRMPPVAESYDEFLAMCSNTNIEASGAIC
ncbi:MAG: hypothetical protein WD039_08670 [Xanthobacteraceae bacterium]